MTDQYCRYMMDLVLRIQIGNLASLRRRLSLRLAWGYKKGHDRTCEQADNRYGH
jgi:hypothetical protein